MASLTQSHYEFKQISQFPIPKCSLFPFYICYFCYPFLGLRPGGHLKKNPFKLKKMFDPKKILVLAPHTDDGELGCGGSMAKFCSEKKDVHYAAFSLCKKSLPPDQPDDILEKECKQAVRQLGMDAGKLMFYDFEVRDFTQKRQEILDELVSLNKYIRPDLIFVPAASDTHQDHQVIHKEALRAFKSSSILGYEHPWNHNQFNSSLFIRLSPEHVEKKVKAIKAYNSQSQRNYMQEEFVRSLAKVRGVQCNSEYAEAFEVYRMIS
jgi:LmbE family N-acetylglucosaminyl deacetylase